MFFTLRRPVSLRKGSSIVKKEILTLHPDINSDDDFQEFMFYFNKLQM